MPHKAILSLAEKVLYVSYSDGAGPYDGECGQQSHIIGQRPGIDVDSGVVYKYDITAGTWTNITTVSGGDLYFGFVDLQWPGTVMVPALSSWWPDGQIFRSTDSGATWSPLW